MLGEGLLDPGTRGIGSVEDGTNVNYPFVRNERFALFDPGNPDDLLHETVDVKKLNWAKAATVRPGIDPTLNASR